MCRGKVKLEDPVGILLSRDRHAFAVGGMSVQQTGF